MDIAKIQKLGEKGNFKKLEALTSDKNIEFRVAAYKALGLITNPESVLLLNTGLRDENVEIRLAATNSLKKVGRENMLEALRLQANKETNSDVKKAIDEAITAIKSR